jgi:phosphate transport system substrate-binding protein
VTFTTGKRIGSLAIAASFVVAACGGGAGATTAPGGNGATGDNGATGTVSGSIFVTGSSTVEPISTGVAEAFAEANASFDYTVEGPGTGDGFKKFCAGEADITDASRAIKDEEAAACAESGIEYVELKVAIDGMSVLTSVSNAAVACLSFPDLYALMGPESTGFAKWSDAAAIATELGSSTVLPDAELVVTGPGEESGTFDSFVELAIAKIAESRGQDPITRPDYTASSNDLVIIDGISGSDTSLGWVGFAFAEENKDEVNEIAIAREANGACVAPTPESIADGSYPLARPLFIYVNTAKAAENAAIGAYVDYYLAEGTIASVLENVPYVNLTAEALAETRSAWEATK